VAKRGADAVLVVAPHYYGSSMTDDALFAHYTAVADASPVPVLLYTIPKYMHFALSAELVARLAQHQNIVGLKDSSGKMEMLNGYLRSQSDSFAVLTGNGGTFQQALDGGARGGILAVALFAAGPALEVLNATRHGDREGASRAQGWLGGLSNRIVGELGIPGVKAALEEIGLTGGPVRPPLRELTADLRSEVTELMRSTPLAAA
jgi:4-hydroxy-2-oxoglutarate aldolase